MRSLFGLLGIIYILCFTPTQAQDTVQSILWNTPNGKLSDFSQTFTTGLTLALSWNSWTSPSYIDASTTLVDLWITDYDSSVTPFNRIVKANISLALQGNFAWTIDIPDNELAENAKYVLRFKKSGQTFDQSTPELSSPGILILKAASATISSRSSSTSSSTLANPSSIPSSTVVFSTAVSPSATSNSTISTTLATTKRGLGSGATAAIGICATAAVIGIILGVCLAYKRRKDYRNVSKEVLIACSRSPRKVSSDFKMNMPPSYTNELPTQGVWV